MRKQRPDLTRALAFSVVDAAHAISVSPETIRRLIATGELCASRVGRRVVIPRAALEKLLEKGAK